jgi:hypothetical protein
MYKCNDKLERKNVMTKDKTFSMRCDQAFLDTLVQLSDAMGVTKSEVVDISVGIYPHLIELTDKLEKLIKDTKDNL